MCKSCAEHSKRAWYLDAKHHRIESQGIIKDMMNWKIMDIIELSNKMLISKKLKTGRSLNTITSNIFNFFAKKFHGGQIVQTLDLALEIIDMAEDVGLTYCICKKGADVTSKEDYRCIILNSFVGFMRRDHPEKIQYLSKEKAKQFVVEKRKQGCLQSVFWGSIPYVSILCNCDQHCGSVLFPELDWAMIPSFYKVSIQNPNECINCKKCLERCHYNARGFADKRPVIQNNCMGCGLCLEACPQQRVASFVERDKIYNPLTGKIIV